MEPAYRAAGWPGQRCPSLLPRLLAGRSTSVVHKKTAPGGCLKRLVRWVARDPGRCLTGRRGGAVFLQELGVGAGQVAAGALALADAVGGS